MSDVADGAQLQELPAEECFALLATQEIGRLGLNSEHYPLIFPVNYALHHTTIVIRTDPGTKLTRAPHFNVAFEVDQIDQQRHSGWSVLVRGHAEELDLNDREDLVAGTKAAAKQPWAPGEHGHWLRLIAHSVSGRRLIPGRLPPIFEPAASL